MCVSLSRTWIANADANAAAPPALAFTRYTFVDSAIVHESRLFLSLDTSGIAPLCILQSILSNI